MRELVAIVLVVLIAFGSYPGPVLPPRVVRPDDGKDEIK